MNVPLIENLIYKIRGKAINPVISIVVCTKLKKINSSIIVNNN